MLRKLYKKIFFILAFALFLLVPNQAYADDFTVSNPRIVNGWLTVDINPTPPDNICSWWSQLHFVYLTDSVGNRVGGFGGCSNNSDGTYTMSEGQAGSYLPDTGTYRVEVYESEQGYDGLSATFDWTSPVPHVNRPPSLQLYDSSIPLSDLPQYRQVWVNLGQTYSVNGSFTDSDSTSWAATINYGAGGGVQPLSLNGNNFSLQYLYSRGGSYLVTSTIVDDQGVEGVITRVVSVIDYGLEASNPRVVNGGFAVDLRGDLPDNLCSWFPAWRHDAYILNENGQGVGGFSSCSNNPDGSYTVSSGNVGGQAVPPDGTYKIKIEEREQPPYPHVTVSNAFVWTANQPSVIDPISDGVINEGQTYTENGSFTDSDSTSWTATVNYGEGAGAQPLTLSGNTFTLNNLYEDNGVYTVTVSVTDNQGVTGIETTQVTVNNANPTLGAISASVNPIQVNTSTTATASFTDAGVFDTHTAVWSWGDGTNSSGTVTELNGSGSIANSHSYTTAGVYEIDLTITDNNNASDQEVFQYLSVYNPTPQGRFNGVRKYITPVGSYIANPNLSGQVLFGITTKYDNNNQPTGDVSMNFKAANFEFEGTSITVLVTGNGKATLRGTGKVNGSGNYNFLATGIDGANDAIRFQIKDSSNNNIIIYDSQIGQSDTADPTASVTGQVIVH